MKLSSRYLNFDRIIWKHAGDLVLEKIIIKV